MKLEYHRLLSTFAFIVNVRHYTTVTAGTPNLRGTSDLSAELNARYARTRGYAFYQYHDSMVPKHMVRTHGYCSPRHRMPLDSRNEGSYCV